MEHKLKILPQYFKAVVDGEKTFELRKNDRGFKVGDTLILQEYLQEISNGNRITLHAQYTGKEISKEVSYILEGGQYGLEEGYCILGLKQEGIILKNIDLTGTTMVEQYKKIEEEEEEFKESLKKCKYDNDNNCYYLDINHVIEEFYDTIQAKLGLINMFGISAEEVMKEYPKHLEKLKDRPREKKCSKCICCNTEEMWCEQDNSKTYEDYAKECKCYEESEE